jgi:Uma2 family endonuclease
MTTQTPTRVGMSMHEYIAAYDRQPFELINGERIPKLPGVFAHARIIRAIVFAIQRFLAEQGMPGEVYFETTYILPDTYDPDWVTGSRTPDILFYAGDRIAQYIATHPEHNWRPLELVPDLIIEVVSPTDKYSLVNGKVDGDLANGVRLVWVVDPQQRTITLHAADAQTLVVLKGAAVLDGGEVLPGFRLSLEELFSAL